ncbi:RNA polymerase sigma factor [Sunxiuqinia sp. A32]|uniref:RNA polymerase sigma factor n=1 Tax=Sunxiuqinia sp. A32 TaxID=3461496 RepID=UPI004045553A
MNGKEKIEKQVIIRLINGDKKAFNQIFDKYNQKLYFFSLGYLKSGKDSEEVVQDTFLKIWERRSSINPELSLHAYLFKIAFNFIQKKLIKIVKDEELIHNFAGELVDFDDHTANLINYNFLLQHINNLIEELPPRQRQVIELRKLDGFTSKEIAEKLSLSLKTVEAHLTAGLKYLKNKLQSEQFDDLLLFILTFRKKVQHS